MSVWPENVDTILFADYFEHLYVPERRIRLPIKPEHREIAEVMESAWTGDLTEQFVCVTMPPRTGKTTLACGLGSWGYGYFPEAQSIFTAYAQDQAKLSLAAISATMKEPWYLSYFPDRIHGDLDDHLSTVQGGNIYAEGVDGQLIGKGAGLKEPAGGIFVMDDPIKAKGVMSKTMIANFEQWVEMTVLNRRNSDRWCKILVIAQRLGPNDPVDYFLRNFRNETLLIKIPCFVDKVSRFPETYSDARYDTLNRTRLGRFVLASQLQQEPAALGGNMIPADKFLRYSAADRNLPWEEKIIVSDTALKKGQGNDYWVLQCWGRIGRRCYLLDQYRGQPNSAEFIRISAQFYAKHMAAQENHPVSRFIMEDAAAGPGVISGLNELGVPVVPIIPIKDKVQRVNDVLPYIETGLVYVPADDDPEAAEWLPDFLKEITAFNADLTHENDDQVDTLAYALNEMLGSGLSILQVLGDLTYQPSPF